MMINNAGAYYLSSYTPSPYNGIPTSYNRRTPSMPPYYNSMFQPPQQQQQQQQQQQKPQSRPTNSVNTPLIKLYDLDTNNQSEIIRLILAFVDIPYKDKYLKKDEWTKIKEQMPFDQLPILRINSQFKIYQIYAIIRYLAHEFRLYGTTKHEHTIVDVVLETTRQFRDKLFEHMNNSSNQEENLRKFLTDQSSMYLKQLEKLFNIFHHHGPFYLGAQISLADLIIYDTVNYLIKLDTKLLDNYIHLKEARRRIGKHPRILNYINSKNINQIKTRFHESSPPKRHRTKSPTPNLNSQQHRHRSHDEYKSNYDQHRHHHHHHRRHSKGPTPVSRTKQRSVISSKSPSILTTDNERTPLRTTDIIPPPPPVVSEQKSEPIVN